MEDVAQQAQLDEAERSHLEDVVKRLRERTEETVEYWVHTKLNLAEEGAEAPATLSAEELKLRERVEEAIEREQVGERSWEKARDLYVKGVGYTLVNRLAALRCMEVRGFLDRSPTRFRDDGVTPAADRLIDSDYFLSREASIWTAFLVACQERSEEIELLFDLSGPYSLLYGDLADWNGEPEELAWNDKLQSSLVELLQDLGGLLDEVENVVWRADDVLGWVYEYYNVPDLEGVRSDVETKEDAIAANQFYTPHWVVRMLVDNSLGKLYLEHDGSLEEAVEHQEKRFTPEERKARIPSIDESPSVADLCSYLVPTEEKGDPTDTLAEEGPRGLRVFDPASGSAHFLLYAFDVLERIWRAETDVDPGKIPEKILEHNLYGVDLDLRACQLAAFNLYLKARSRAEEEGNENFQMPDLGIVCADAHVADLDRSHVVFDEVAGEDDELRDALDSILKAFEHIEGLGSLLDVKGTLDELIEDNGGQLDAFRDRDVVTLPQLLKRLHNAVDDHMEGESFRAEDLRSFLRLLVILSQDYDVALMNPPYGMGTRMPDPVQEYVRRCYEYYTDYYISFFEVCERLCKSKGRVGMLVPWSFMFRKVFEGFRRDFISEDRQFDFLAEFGYGILDNATVGTVGTLIRVDDPGKESGTFIRLHDVEKEGKEKKFVSSYFENENDGKIKRKYVRNTSEFSLVPGASVSYWVPVELRSIYESEKVVDSKNAELPKRDSIGSVKVGLQTSDDERFLRFFWEVETSYPRFEPVSNGGKNTWLLPKNQKSISWKKDGKIVDRYASSQLTNSELYFNEGISFNRRKRSGRHFGYMHENSIFTESGTAIFPDSADSWALTAYLNSRLVTYLKLAQTFERKWEISTVSRLPVISAVFEEKRKLAQAAKDQIAHLLSKRTIEFSSPHFCGCAVVQMVNYQATRSYKHPHRSLLNDVSWKAPPSSSIDASFQEISETVEEHLVEIDRKIERMARDTDEIIFNSLDIPEDRRDEILQEVGLRTIDNPLASIEEAVGSGSKDEASTQRLVKKLLLQLSLDVLAEDDDGVVLIGAESESEEDDLMERIEEKFEEIWKLNAQDRLNEADSLLGDREPTDEPYPNLRHWLENDLFAFHCDEFENTPILWELTTERLGEDDKEDAGFACLIDYHQLGPDVFDRLSARYLETRKAALRERQQSARHTAEGSEGKQAREARQEEKRCESALRQIDALETKISELTQPKPRDWADAVRDDARDLKPKVRRFRERLEERLETLDALHEEAPTDWFKDQFSPKFMESVGSNREEWIDALEDLEAACEQFARPADQPVEAHLYDLLPYFDDLTGSDHYSSNGIFFLNYYFSKGKDLADEIDQGKKSRVTRREKLVADLARETDEDIELGKEINEACQEMKKHMESDWTPRALKEVRTPGYRPVKKHGVAINITPLAEKKLVPELVEEKVI